MRMQKLMGSEMFKYIVISITAASCSGIGCPMGLGKEYTNKPAFFHSNFYANKQETLTSESATQIVAQQNTNDTNSKATNRSAS